MTAALIVILALGIMLSALVIAYSSSGSRRTPLPAAGRQRILFPFVAEGLSVDALDCALRLAAAEDATLVPAFLARVSLTLPLQAALPRQGAISLGLQEAIEQRAGVCSGSPSKPGSNAAGPTGTRCEKRSPTSGTTRSSSPPPTPTARASPPPMPAGCSTTFPGRSSSSDPTPRDTSHHHVHSARQNPSRALLPTAKRTGVHRPRPYSSPDGGRHSRATTFAGGSGS